MSQYDYDLFVIGAGSGGTRAARIAANHGARVAIAERQYLGGTCVNVGCVPKKLMTFFAGYAHHIEDARAYGWRLDDGASPDWPSFIQRKNAEIERLNGIYRKLLVGSGAEIHWGDVKIVDPHTVEMNGTRYTTERILVAVGGHSVKPPIPGAADFGLTSDDLFFLDHLPKRMVIIGVGYIGVEFANIFNRLGTEVTIVHRRDRLLNDAFDHEARDFLMREMGKQSIEFRMNSQIERVEKVGDGELCVHTSGELPIFTDAVLFATGRKPQTEGLGLEEAGVTLRKSGGVIVDENYQSNVPSIYAIGDVIEREEFTPVAIKEGHVLVDRLFGGPGVADRQVNYDHPPYCVFANPQLGMVGMTEQEARDTYPGEIDIYAEEFRAMRVSFAKRDQRTLMKLVVHRSSDRVLGVHMVGDEAGEIIQGMAVALTAGATKAQFDATIAIHPTSAEEFVTMRTPRPQPEEERQAAE